MTVKPLRLISDEPTLLNLIDEVISERQKTLLAEDGLWRDAMDFSKDVMRYMRNYDNIINTLGSILLNEVLTIAVLRLETKMIG